MKKWINNHNNNQIKFKNLKFLEDQMYFFNDILII